MLQGFSRFILHSTIFRQGIYVYQELLFNYSGDGIGPELTGYVKEAVRFSGAPVDFEELGVNRESSEAELENALLALSRNGVGLKGNRKTSCCYDMTFLG